MAFARRSFSGNAPDTILVAAVDDVTLTVTASDFTGWPDGTDGNFVVIFEPGTANEEKCLASGISGSTLSLVNRGWEGSAVSHAATTTTIRHGYSAHDADEANNAVSQTIGQVAAKGDLLVGSSANTLTKLGIGSSGKALIVSGGTLAYGVPTIAESDVTGLVDDLAALMPVPETDGTLGSLLVGKSDGSYDSVAAGSTGTSPVVQSDGTVAFGAVPSALLAAAETTAATSSTFSYAALDSTNLTLSFKAPASGKVLLRASGFAYGTTGGTTSGFIGWYVHGTTTVVGTKKQVQVGGLLGSGFCASTIVTGLTAGSTYQYDVAGGTTTCVLADVCIEVWSA